MRKVLSTPVALSLSMVLAVASVATIATITIIATVQPAHAQERHFVSGIDRSGEVTAAAFPSLLSCVRVEGPLEFCGEPVPLDIGDVRERLEKELLILLWDRAQVILHAKRAGRHFPYIEQRLKKRGMPDDLKYIAVIESALRPHAGSDRGAVGYWQFIRPTALKYGLRVDKSIDERRNIYTSTEAALDYLQELHAEFGSWAVACAAYNMGENGMRKRIRIQEVQDYYRLYLPLETQAYVFRALAAKMILSDPVRYGFHFVEEDFYSAPEFDRISLTLEKDTPLAEIARAAGTYYKAIKDLNTQILGDDLVRGEHVLLLPRGAGPGFEARLKESAIRGGSVAEDGTQPERGDSGKKELRVYVVRPGDNVHAIARRLDVSLNAVLKPNGLRSDSVIHPGQRLLVED